MVKGTLVLTTKAVKSPSAALKRLKNIAPSIVVFGRDQPKACSEAKLFANAKKSPTSDTVIAVNNPAFQVAVHEILYCPP